MSLKIEDLAQMIRDKRGRIGVRAAADEVGVSSATLSRVENGNVPDLETFAKICRWLAVDPAVFLGMQPAREPKQALPVAHFRKKKSISPETAKSLGALILAAQQAMEEREHLIKSQ